VSVGRRLYDDQALFISASDLLEGIVVKLSRALYVEREDRKRGRVNACDGSDGVRPCEGGTCLQTVSGNTGGGVESYTHCLCPVEGWV
jgi:hypothetical protein